MKSFSLASIIAVAVSSAWSMALAFAPLAATTTKGSTALFAEKPPKLNVAVIGAGPSGLLLSHLLLRQENTEVTLVEARSDPRQEGSEGRAYALGLGIRGRTAIRKVDEKLWQAIKQRGFESERFQLHIGGLVIPLRSEKDGKAGVEPSLLTFQSDLCAALVEELELRFGKSGRLKMLFDRRVEKSDLEKGELTLDNKLTLQSFNLVVGCDGVNSVVRTAIHDVFPSFQSKKEKLPGAFKVVRMDEVPPNVDPKSVSLLLPKKGSSGAFIEPTGSDGSCCILFSGKAEGNPLLSENKNKTAVVEALEAAFPKWVGFHEPIAEQLMAQTVTGTSSSVECNTYHYKNKAVLVGDAAHATGGVSGQGVNSALMDSVALDETIHSHRNDLGTALMLYSLSQVPAGKALYDLSFGPKPKGLKALKWAFLNTRDTLFRGRLGIGKAPLQTRLTTDLIPFAEIRRERDSFYDEPFPTEKEFREKLAVLHGDF